MERLTAHGDFREYVFLLDAGGALEFWRHGTHDEYVV